MITKERRAELLDRWHHENPDVPASMGWRTILSEEEAALVRLWDISVAEISAAVRKGGKLEGAPMS